MFWAKMPLCTLTCEIKPVPLVGEGRGKILAEGRSSHTLVILRNNYTHLLLAVLTEVR